MTNKNINGRQCNIIWHVDHSKISHLDKMVIEDIIRQLNSKFWKESPLTTTCGKVLEYLGMTLDYTTKGRVKISRYKYIKKLLSELPSDMNGTTKTPTAVDLFDVNKDAKKLPKTTAQLFHHLVAKLLYLSRLTKQDIQTSVPFLCTRLQALNEDDYKKLARVKQYI